jgi:hypothetical protein
MMGCKFSDSNARLLTAPGQFQQLPDFVQRHAESLGPADETQRSDRVIVIDPIAIW